MVKIGILQLTQNLDDAVNGFKAGLQKHDITAEYFYLNADGRMEALPILAQQLALTKPDLLFACSTPAAKAAISLPIDIPVIFTPVFDPVGGGLVGSFKQPGGKATGVAGMVPAIEKISFMRQLLPTAETIGILCHTADPNCLLETSNFVKAAEGILDIVQLPIHQAEQLSHLPAMLSSKLDALFLPIGRVLEENFASIVYYTDALNLPIIASHGPNVPLGALGGLVANHYRLGEACAVQAVQILSGVHSGTIPVGMADAPDILLNQFAADTLGITLPASLLAGAAEVFE